MKTYFDLIDDNKEILL